LIEQLSVGGKLIIPVGDDESQVLKLVQREPSGFHREDLGECRFVKLWGKFGWQD
jgi:protein-L-isoaspartate(D-aspartate) O-methyltransferase